MGTNEFNANKENYCVFDVFILIWGILCDVMAERTKSDGGGMIPSRGPCGG